MDTWSCVLIHSDTLCPLLRACKVIIDRFVVIEFISKEWWFPSGKKENKETRTQRGPPGLNLAQVCILFFSPTSRQLNLSANRKTKENVFSEAHGNSSPQAPETLKCFHSVLSGVLFQSQIMRNTVVYSRGHMSASTSLPFLGAIEQEPHNKCSIPKSGGRFWVTRVASFSHLSFLALASVLGHRSPRFTAPHFPPGRTYLFPSLNCLVLPPLQIFIKLLLYGKH